MPTVGGECRLEVRRRRVSPERREPPLRLIQGRLRIRGHECLCGRDRRQQIIDLRQRIPGAQGKEREEHGRWKHLTILGRVATGKPEPDAAAKPAHEPPPRKQVSRCRIVGHRQPGVRLGGIEQRPLAVGQ